MKGYKFVFYDGLDRCVALIELEIPDDAIIVQPMDFETKMPQSKLRCDKVKFINVINYYRFSMTNEDIDLTPIKNTPHGRIFRSIYDRRFRYQLGQTYTSEIDTDIYEMCRAGIHFFINSETARDWMKSEVSPWWLFHKYYN